MISSPYSAGVDSGFARCPDFAITHRSDPLPAFDQPTRQEDDNQHEHQAQRQVPALADETDE